MKCPAGHDSKSEDYCDVCGVAMPAMPDAAASTAAPACRHPGRPRGHRVPELLGGQLSRRALLRGVRL